MLTMSSSVRPEDLRDGLAQSYAMLQQLQAMGVVGNGGPRASAMSGGGGGFVEEND